MPKIEFWRYKDWTMVYKDGLLVKAGDHYHANEWLQAEVGVKLVDDDAGVCIPDGHNPIRILSEVREREAARLDRLQAADQLRKKAEGLLAEAAKLEAQK
jgi:hypothetical protein